MYPYKLFTLPDGSGITLYEILIIVGVIAAIVLFRILADKREMPAKLQNLILFGGVVSFVVGYLSAVLFQAVYNALETGEFSLNGQTGSTFYGGLIGGTVCMLLIYFIGGKILYKKSHDYLHWFPTFANIAAACIPFAHGFGRIGCLMAGCCHGRLTDAWYGIPMDIGALDGVYVKVVPIQLFEALFLFALAAFLIFLNCKKKGYCIPVYFIGYGIWRFIIEYFRDDDRGATFISFLTPSQLTAVFLILGGIAIIAITLICKKKFGSDFFLPPKVSHISNDDIKKDRV